MRVVLSYLRETRNELRHVDWPGLNKVLVFTILVIIFSIIMAYILGFTDRGFVYGIGELRTVVNPQSAVAPELPTVNPGDIQITGPDGQTLTPEASEQIQNAINSSQINFQSGDTVETVQPTTTVDPQPASTPVNVPASTTITP